MDLPVIDRLLPVAAAEHAARLDDVLRSVHLHIAIQAVAWGAFFVYCVVRFRRHRHPVAAHAGLPPLVPTLAIAFVVLGDAWLLVTSALPAWQARAVEPSAASRPLEVRVAAEQFAWNIHYPGPDGRFGTTRTALISAANPVGIDRTDAAARDDIGLLNILTVPLGRPVIVTLTARDVIHSFTINEMRVKQDATPGLTVRTWFTPTLTGRFDIRCSQLCGPGHARMRGEVSVVSGNDWDRWLAAELALIPPPRP
jgi:cytochrome c oxidase subunit 2